MEPESRRQKVGMYVALGFVLLPGLIVGGFMPELDVLPAWGWLAVATAGGAAGGAVWDEERPLLGCVAGGSFGACALVAVPVYVWLRSGLGQTYFSAEFLLPAGLAVLPSAALYAVVNKLRASASAPEPTDGGNPANPYDAPR